ncbi:BTAD domain-containing putative transcriptional regulator [Streptomyces sp. NPDC051217]|uniref:BTAD domain-containing putative transcriptional regulator n=1 Tax=Streptomyces sp. NPDC051217 TaxID=3365644 RepID=UPI0037BD2676
MRFSVLGPLEVTAGERTVELVGVKQRAALGYLLLHANQIVPISRLLGAMWSVGEAPATSRKILQNAVWGLRRALAADSHPRSPAMLLTRAPGYQIRVEPDQVDLYLYDRWVKDGRNALAADDPALSAASLRKALALWRGPALADVAETGAMWPELNSLQSARLDVMEDYFEAELACGRYLSVLSAVESMVEAEPLRERACGQLMRALYYCGRQADALGVYSRVRTALIEGLGLEPGRELRLLQEAILTHDPALHVPTPLPGVPHRASVSATSVSASVSASASVDTPESPVPARREPARGDQGSPTERRNVSVLLVRGRLGNEFSTVPAERVDDVLEGVAAMTREKIEQHGGVVAASIGSVCLGLFEARDDAQDGGRDGASRAVRAAVAIRDSLVPAAVPAGPACSAGAAGGPDDRTRPALRGLAVRAAVATGDALVRHRSDDSTTPLSVNGALLDVCHSLLALVPLGAVQVCDNTHRATVSEIRYRRIAGTPSRWAAEDTARPARSDLAVAARPAPVTEHESELDLMRGILERTRRCELPHLVTVLGESDGCRSQVLAEFRRRASGGGSPGGGHFLFWHAPPSVPDGPHALRREIVATYCGLREGDSPATVDDKLCDVVQSVARSREGARRLRIRLGSLLAPVGSGPRGTGRREVEQDWRQFLGHVARDRPLVIVMDDLHLAGARLLDLVENLAGTAGPVPLLTVAAARPELLLRRPSWSGGGPHTATITINGSPAPEPGMNQLLESLLAT